MSKKLLNDNEFKKISGGWKSINKGIELATSGIECAAGLAVLGFSAYSLITEKNEPKKTSTWINLDGLGKAITAVTMSGAAFCAIDGARRFISQAKNLY